MEQQQHLLWNVGLWSFVMFVIIFILDSIDFFLSTFLHLHTQNEESNCFNN
jgi:hypothetical protein